MKTINNKAHSTIILHLSDEVLREVSKEKTASGLWEKLKELFLKKSLAKRLYMKRKLYTFSMKDGTALKDHVDEFNKLILDLENVNIVLEDEDRALILLSSLPDSYEHFVDTLLYGRQTLTLKDVKNALESKDLKRRIDGKDQNPAESLIAKAKPDKKFYKDKKNSNQKDKPGKKKKKRKSSEDEGMSDDADVLIAAEKQSSGEWILDSGCSFHMCPNIDFFKTFESIDGGKVLLGNNLACKVAGIGTISIRMFDGIERDLKQTLDYVHSDLWGPSQVSSHGGARYFITFIDDYSRRVWFYVLKHKSEAFEKFKEWTALMETQTEKRLKRLRTDNGLEFCSSDFENFCKSKGIARHRTVRHTPQQNGLIERMNRTLIEKGKLDPRAVKGYFIGYPEGIKGYKIWCIDGKPSRTLVESRDSLKESKEMIDHHQESATTSELDNYQLARDREKRVVKLPKRYGIADLISYALMVADEVTGDEPESYKQAMNSRDKLKWLNAMEEEMASLKENNTWVLVQRPAGRRLVGYKWIFKLKEGVAGSESVKYKARLVAKGFTQKEGIDFNK
ncbi:hypothetical protein KPL71_017172 [Citrus sinensis]|uniref:Uncharacterized protein n=1 Tax=Citrus sinensis TaxID=2711 RepID=A0ACB8JPY1_CITSI|nr:hypothetical protein KPL71_017172 [Citrus sinensis]